MVHHVSIASPQTSNSMRKTLLVACMACLFGASQAVAQDSQVKMTLSYFQCDWPETLKWVSAMDSLSLPIWQEVVDEGLLGGQGVLVHDFAGYENVIIWRAGSSVEQIRSGLDEIGRRYQERHLDAPPLGCGLHRDAIFTMGPSTGTFREDDETTVVSHFKCDFAKLGDISAAIDSTLLPIAKELTDEGYFGNWGFLFHDWAGDENIVQYRSASDKESFFVANAEFNKRFAERHGDYDPFMGCNAHKDEFFRRGPRTKNAPPATEGESDME
jgi:hypothetical protein